MKNKCPLCPKSFQSRKKLERHCLKYHGMKLEDINEQYFMIRRTVINLLNQRAKDGSR